MRAVMLAAGVGNRLGPGPAPGPDDGGAPPKALLEFGGASLLRRHIAILRRAGIDELVIVVGYRAEDIEAEIAACDAEGFARTLFNPDFREGSIVSLWTARPALTAGGDVLLMDADVLYDHRMIARLTDTAHANCFLMDRDFEPGDEPVKICLRGGRIVDFDKRVDDGHEVMGESVGFFRFSARVAGRLAEAAGQDIASGRRAGAYEAVIRELVLAAPPPDFGVEDVTGLPWIEIDFPEDIARARDEILPRLEEKAP